MKEIVLLLHSMILYNNFRPFFLECCADSMVERAHQNNLVAALKKKILLFFKEERTRTNTE